MSSSAAAGPDTARLPATQAGVAAPLARQTASQPGARPAPSAVRPLVEVKAEPALPRALADIDPNQPPIAIGLSLCEAEQPQLVRQWFDSLMPGDRIELLSLLQANMAGERVPGAAEPASVRPLARALGLLAA
jgi:hypothetical protein